MRVSTERQDAEADGLERQAERIRQFCRERGLTCLSIYEDVGSAVADGNSSGRDGLMDDHACEQRRCWFAGH
ncbi:recombinase family protein [Cypionkella sp.]|uniref:recombinase family protein n=1 Tax=Cypionkella sp. TaxID=2811411 RepID=UPI00351D7DDA